MILQILRSHSTTYRRFERNLEAACALLKNFAVCNMVITTTEIVRCWYDHDQVIRMALQEGKKLYMCDENWFSARVRRRRQKIFCLF